MSEMTPLERRMANGQPFTYGELCLCFSTSRPRDEDRLIDRTIQRWRKSGLIALKREGRQAVWSLTEKGRGAFHVQGV